MKKTNAVTGRRRLNARAALTVLLATGAMLLAGCGFHLQGASPLPDGIQSMYVSYNDDYRVGDPPLVETLRQRLRERGVLGQANAPARLDIEEIENRQRIVSVSPVDGRVAEYELTTAVSFDYDVKGASQLRNETLRISRNYSFDNTERLGAEQEQRELLTSMHEELANLILLRVASANDKL
ncbi:rare lipoprotein B [Salinisphaera dokdonensis CL-ES53]|jgi:LPS-assembly lipoprotein|uniref:LPS-assembly lipoprotein LptE n=1 Tax=Salinisphaera dokdonensis CL-ES53 TaxID=1304272 RepID=A0ABV2AX83_9GAMM